MFRFFIDFILFTSIFLLPWWLVLVFSFLLTFYFSHFYEIFFLGLLIDILFSVPREIFYNFQYITVVITVIIYMLSLYIQKNIRLYK